MKLKTSVALVCCAVGLLKPYPAHAQGVITCLDNTSQPIVGTMSLGAPTGVQFQTGANPGGYMLNNIELLFAPPVGNPAGTGFYLNVFEDYYGGLGNAIALLDTRDNPATAGLCNFLPSSIPLLPSTSTLYFWPATSIIGWCLSALTAAVCLTTFN